MYDVLIVGAGPAGATAAYYLGRAGCRVMILEKQYLPRYKPCGGGLSLQFLQKTFPFSFDPVIDLHVRQMQYRFLNMDVAIPIPKGEMAMVMRDRFDQYILSQANCDLREGTSIRGLQQDPDTVTVETTAGEKITARHLIGADGANSVVAHSLGLRRKTLIPALEFEAQVPDAVYKRFADGPVFIFEGPRYGYQWIFPKANCLSVGIAGYNPKHGELQATFSRTMREMGIPLGNAVQHGHSIPVYSPRKSVMAGRVLLAGDAAGSADPFSGEGIRPAIQSGRIAAEAILSGHPEQYPATFRNELGNRNLKSILIGRIFYGLSDFCLLLGAPNPITTEAILDSLSGHGSALYILAKSALSLPYFISAELLSEMGRFLGGPDREKRLRAVFFPNTYGRLEKEWEPPTDRKLGR
jgi:geranylgeranyl reductase family protein